MTKRKENYERIDEADVEIGDELQEIPPMGNNFSYDPAGLPDSDSKAFGAQASAMLGKLAHEQHVAELTAVETAIHNLLESGVIVSAESTITWRVGHLEHLACEFARDKYLAWQLYFNDLVVATNADRERFDALVAEARGE